MSRTIFATINGVNFGYCRLPGFFLRMTVFLLLPIKSAIVTLEQMSYSTHATSIEWLWTTSANMFVGYKMTRYLYQPFQNSWGDVFNTFHKEWLFASQNDHFSDVKAKVSEKTNIRENIDVLLDTHSVISHKTIRAENISSMFRNPCLNIISKWFFILLIFYGSRTKDLVAVHQKIIHGLDVLTAVLN